jgi:dihydroorotate dehydrogenase electron transfer subunit
MCDYNEKEAKKVVVFGKVIHNEAIAKDIYKMTIGGEKLVKICGQAKAGQFINVYLKDKSTLLPRPISICQINEESLDIVYKVVGKGTEELSHYKECEDIKISSALGNGYTFNDHDENSIWTQVNRKKECVLVGGGVGIPPLIQLAKELKNRQAYVTVILGFQEETFLVEEAEKYCDQLYIATENGTKGYNGNVVQLIKEKGIGGDEFYSCGPKPMLKALADHCKEIDAPLQVSLEERMGCGYGACVGCTYKIVVDGETVQKAVCKDGPVFPGKEVVWDE